MAEANKDKPGPKQDELVSKLVKDAQSPPDTLLLSGHIGASSEEGHTRLYFDPQLSDYVEIPNDAILHTQEVPKDQSPLGGTFVWIKSDAVLTHGKVGPNRLKAKFLEGRIQQEFVKAQAAGGQAVPHVTLPAVGCPSQIGPTCPTVAVGICPTHVPIGCPTNLAICTHAGPQCPTHQLECTHLGPTCPTFVHTVCSTCVGPACPTHVPPCTVTGPTCPTHVANTICTCAGPACPTHQPPCTITGPNCHTAGSTVPLPCCHIETVQPVLCTRGGPECPPQTILHPCQIPTALPPCAVASGVLCGGGIASLACGVGVGGRPVAQAAFHAMPAGVTQVVQQCNITVGACGPSLATPCVTHLEPACGPSVVTPCVTQNQPICHPSVVIQCPTVHQIQCLPSVHAPCLTQNQPVCHPSIIIQCPTVHQIQCLPSVHIPCVTLNSPICQPSVGSPCVTHVACTAPPLCPIASAVACPPVSLGCGQGGFGQGVGVAQAAGAGVPGAAHGMILSVAHPCVPVTAIPECQHQTLLGCPTFNLVQCHPTILGCPVNTRSLECLQVTFNPGCVFPTRFCPSAFCPQTIACGQGGGGGINQF